MAFMQKYQMAAYLHQTNTLILSLLSDMFIEPTVSTASFCKMKGVLFLVLHIYIDAKDTKSSWKGYRAKI